MAWALSLVVFAGCGLANGLSTGASGRSSGTLCVKPSETMTGWTMEECLSLGGARAPLKTALPLNSLEHARSFGGSVWRRGLGFGCTCSHVLRGLRHERP